MKRQKEDYTVAWICALPFPEWRASRLLFDGEEHEEPTLPESHYQYAFGVINGHNVVMGCLPPTEMGVNSAASVASEMRTIFPALRFALLVGVAGGVPTFGKDIRLGDVVVSLPNPIKQHGGVVQYDFGKAMQDGTFQQIGMLNKPPHVLLSALGKVQSGAVKNGRFESYLLSFMKFSGESPEFSNAPTLDRLFQAHYVHPKNEATCRNCEKQFEIERVRREPYRPEIHYGTIASGNQVMKDALKRDIIVQEQSDIICFEMEAAGLMNQFPCLVIRGICDYCDSHKNDSWQPFAAAAAAAWTKELLRNVRPTEVSGVDTITELVKQDARQRVTMLPYGRDKDFVGRSNVLAEIQGKLSDRTSHCRVALHGLGGVGKSQIAIECAWRLTESFRDLSVFWIYASSPERFYFDYQSIARRMKLEGYNNFQDDQLEIVRTWLESDESGIWLLIIDNADNKDFTSGWPPQQTGTFNFKIPTYLPRKPGCAILVTSRDRFAAFDLVSSSDAIVHIDAMDEEDAVELFRKKAVNHHSWNPVQARLLVTELECIPLAITQAAAYLTQTSRMTIGGYLELFRGSEQTRLLTESQNDLRRDVNVPNSVIRTWEISFNRVQIYSTKAVETLFRMSLLDRHRVPDSLLMDGEDSSMAFHEAVETLLRFSFIQVSPYNRKQLEIHRLMQLATRTWMIARGEHRKWLYKAMKRVWSHYPDGGYENRDECQDLEPHAEAVVRMSLELEAGTKTSSSTPVTEYRMPSSVLSDTTDEDHKLLFKIKEVRGRLLRNRAFFAHYRGQHLHAFQLAERAWNDVNAIMPESDQYRLACGSLLAASCVEVGENERAAVLGELIFKQQRAYLSAEHPDTLNTMTHLGAAYHRLGRIDEAKPLLVNAVNEYKQSEDPDTESMLMSINELAAIHLAEREYKASEILLQNVIAKSTNQQGEDHPYTLNAGHNLADCYFLQKRLDEAVRLFRRVLQKKANVLQRNHPSTLLTSARLVEVYRLQGRFTEALNLLLVDLNVLREGPEDGNQAMKLDRIIFKIAQTYRRMGILHEAVRFAKECVDWRAVNLDQDDTELRVAQWFLVRICMELVIRRKFEERYWRFVESLRDSQNVS